MVLPDLGLGLHVLYCEDGIPLAMLPTKATYIVVGLLPVIYIYFFFTLVFDLLIRFND